MMSPELRLLIESCKVFLLEGKINHTGDSMERETIDWDKLQRMAGYHSIRPIVCNKTLEKQFVASTGAHGDFVDRLHRVSIHKAIQQQMNTAELERLLLLLEQRSIPVFPYKGAILSKILYASNNLREWSDLDIYVPRKFAKAALKALISDGYAFTGETMDREYSTDSQTIDNVLSVTGWHEVGLCKSQENSLPIHIDFYWQLCEDFYPYRINEDEVIEKAGRLKLIDSEVVVPSMEHIFLMTLLHHGGRESWMRLKHLCDLALFIKQFPENSFWERILTLSRTARLRSSLLLGCYCVQTYLNISLPAVLSKEVKRYSEKKTKMILKSWEYSVSFWESMNAQLIHKRILLSHQDEGFSRYDYWHKYIKFYTNPNLIEQPRLITFDKKYKIANFLSKVITYAWNKGFKKSMK